MNYLILIIVAIIGIEVGAYFARKRNDGLLAGQAKKKVENKQKILEFLQGKKKMGCIETF